MWPPFPQFDLVVAPIIIILLAIGAALIDSKKEK